MNLRTSRHHALPILITGLLLTVLILAATGCSAAGSRGSAKEDKGQAANGGSSPTTSSSRASDSTRLMLPEATLHPGATNPDVTQENIKSTICTPGFTKKIRPDKSYTDDLKKQQISNEGLPGNPSDYEEDHLISLELGGNPKDPKNLWPEPWEKKGSRLASSGTGAETKDHVENHTHDLVCSGQMSLADAQQAIASDWHALWEKEGEPND